MPFDEIRNWNGDEGSSLLFDFVRFLREAVFRPTRGIVQSGFVPDLRRDLSEGPLMAHWGTLVRCATNVGIVPQSAGGLAWSFSDAANGRIGVSHGVGASRNRNMIRKGQIRSTGASASKQFAALAA